MISQRFFLHLLQVLGFFSLPILAGETKGQFWILRAANDVADPLVEAAKGKPLPPAELASKITSLIEQKKVQELARFDQIIGEGPIRRQNLNGEMRYPDSEEKIDMGVILEAEVTLAGDFRRADLRFVTEIYEKKSRDVYSLKRSNMAHTLYGDGWELMDFWKNAKETTLCLARITDYPVTTDAVLKSPATVLHVELLEAKPEDVAQFRKSTPATREKAVTWLRGRSKLLAGTLTKINPGQRSSHEDGVESLDGERGGFTLMSEQTTSGDGKQVDITLDAKWQDPEKPAAEEDYQFSVGETLEVGQTQLLEPSIAPKSKGPLPVLLVTAQVSLSEIRVRESAAPKDPGSLSENLSTANYPVAPKFTRIVQNTRDPNNRQSLRESLIQRGFEFPQGTSVVMSASSCTVMLTHYREGHIKFAALLKELNLLP
ncbi:MAG: hypothetical protein ACRDBP_05495 [Luteolibacter sp.]